MTYRERREAKAERLRDWAAKREQAATATLNSHPEIRHDWAFITQPGHIPLRAQMNRSDDRACQSLAKAKSMESRANGIEAQLDRSIYSDDDSATEALKARIAENEAKRDRMKLINKLYKKGDALGLEALGINLESLKSKLATAGAYWGSAPHLPYEMTNLGARIRADQKRIEEVTRRQTRTEQAEQAGGVVINGDAYVSVTFAEKPEREILDSLKNAGFSWSGGSWYGYRVKLPAGLQPEVKTIWNSDGTDGPVLICPPPEKSGVQS